MATWKYGYYSITPAAQETKLEKGTHYKEFILEGTWL